jgi:hypothetical protein
VNVDMDMDMDMTCLVRESVVLLRRC